MIVSKTHFSFIRNKLILIFKAKFKYFHSGNMKKKLFLKKFLFSGKYITSLPLFKNF